MSPEDAILSAAPASLLPSVTPQDLLSTMTALSSNILPSATALPSNATTSASSQPGAEHGECQLLGPFALFIQGALGLLALLSLVFKRWRERPQRPVKIWFFDASKQVVGSGLLHIANLLMSMVSSGELKPKAEHYQANPCSFYLLNLAIDTTLGIPILILALRVLTHFFRLTILAKPPESLESGNYGHPPRATWWLKQCFIYFLGLLGMKFCVFIIFQLCPWIVAVGDWALRWTEGDERIQVFFVMLFFPVVMNALQYYIIDSFIKDQKPAEHEQVASDDGSEGEEGSEISGDEGNPEDREGGQHHRGRRRGRRGGNGNSEDGLHSEDEAVLTKSDADVRVLENEGKDSPSPRITAVRPETGQVQEYNPETDGATGGSSAGSANESSAHTSAPASREGNLRSR